MAETEEQQVNTDEEESEEEDIPLEQKLKIANFFVGATCAGEQAKVVKHLKDFLKDQYEDPSVETHLINRAEKCCQIVDGAVISDLTKTDEGYVNVSSGKTVTLSVKDHTLKAEEAGDAEISDRAGALQKVLEKYIDTNYHQDANKAVAVTGDEDDLNVIISADRINLSNYWSGQMNSRWTVSGGVKGTITLKLHYFEGGNVMFDASKEVEWNGDPPSEGDDFGKDVIKIIGTLETEYQQAWSDYFNSQDKSIMSVRRALTMQKTKFDWRLSQANMVQALG